MEINVNALKLAAENLAEEKKISLDAVYDALEQAMAAAYKRHFQKIGKVYFDRETGEIKVYSEQEVVAELTDEDFENDLVDLKILLEDAKKINPDYEIGDVIREDVTPDDFGRLAAQAAKQVIVQKMREAERESIMEEYEGKEGEMATGAVFREDTKNFYIDLGRTHAILSKLEIIPGETIKMGSSIKAYITKIEKNSKGPLILLSRKHYGFLRRLLELEIPELADGTIMLEAVARDAGNRSKISVYSSNDRIDAVGACIGAGGSRINRISEALGGEKIDVVRYDKDPKVYIANALSPAKNVRVMILDPKEQLSIAIVDQDNLSLAIGRGGQNVRLASRLTHFQIDVKSEADAAEMGILLEAEE